MIIYVLLISILIYFSDEEAKGRADYDKNRYVFYLIFLLLFIISGFRKDVGTDFSTYLEYFKGIFNDTFDYMNIELGYKLINYLTAFISNWEQSIFILTSLFILLCFFYTVQKYSELPIYSIFAFVSLYFYFHSFNITRQYIAIGITFFGFQYLVNKKLFSYILVCLVASTFHRIALIMLPFYFISNKRFSKKTYVFGILMTFVTMASLPYLIRFVAILIPKYKYYVDFTSSGSTAFIPLAISVVGFIIFYVTKEKYNITDNKYTITMNAVYISVLFNILAFSNILMYRLGTFFMVYLILIIPTIIVIWQKRWYHFSTVITVLLLITMLYQLINNNSGVLPYTINLPFFFN